MISLIVSIIILAVIILALRFAVELVYVIAAVISYRAKTHMTAHLVLQRLRRHIFFSYGAGR